MIKNIFHFTLNILKDIFGLIVYILAFHILACAPICIAIFLVAKSIEYSDYIEPLLAPLNLIFGALNEECAIFVSDLIGTIIITVGGILIFYYTLWLPMFVTNYALDKKWNRILNTFFEKIQYSTIFLILLITLQFVIENTDWLNIAQYIESEFWLKVIKDIKSYLIPYIIFYTFIYLSTIARKFAKKEGKTTEEK